MWHKGKVDTEREDKAIRRKGTEGDRDRREARRRQTGDCHCSAGG